MITTIDGAYIEIHRNTLKRILIREVQRQTQVKQYNLITNPRTNMYAQYELENGDFIFFDHEQIKTLIEEDIKAGGKGHGRDRLKVVK